MYTWNDDDVDVLYHKFGNCFETREQAETASAKVKELLLSMSVESGASSAHFPKLTVSVFDLPECPEWAKYAAVGNSGYAYWFKDKPLPGIDRSTTSILVAWTEYDIKQLIPGLWDSSAWQNSLIERPKPKLTTEVFNRSDCPKNVQYAVVTSEGRVVGYTSKPYINKEYDCWGFNEGCSFTISAVGTFDSTDWQNSLVERPGKFDASDWQNSLIERPAKLPDWCKPGAWIYTSSEQYLKINGVSIDLQKIELSNGATWSKQDIIDEAVSARLRPYNADEMKALVGKVVQKGRNLYLVTAYIEEYKSIIIASLSSSLLDAELLIVNNITIDGKLCGCLEHLENGEWVK
jgi:hypothetical protein